VYARHSLPWFERQRTRRSPLHESRDGKENIPSHLGHSSHAQLSYYLSQKLGKDQPAQFIFTDCSGRIIGNIESETTDQHYDLNNDNHVKISGVDRGQIETPQITNGNNHETPQGNPVIDDKPGIEVDIVSDDNQEVDPPLIQEADAINDTPAIS
jgi:hypothetical protein